MSISSAVLGAAVSSPAAGVRVEAANAITQSALREGTSEARRILEERLGIERTRDRPEGRSALLYPAGGRTVALVVDEVLGRKEILVKPLRPPLDGLRAYEGAALLQDGTLALVLDPVSLVSI